MPFDTAISPQQDSATGGMVPIESGRDLAAEARDQQQKFELDEDLTQFFNETLWKTCANLNSAEWLAIKRQMVRCRYYFDSHQYGEVNEQCQWVDDDRRTGEINYVDNDYFKNIQTCLMELERDRTQLTFKHIAPDSRYGKQVAKIAEQRYLAHRARLFPAIKTQQENLSRLLNGLALRYTFFDFNKSQNSIPKFGQNQVEGSETEVCAVCSKPKQVEGGECDNCGSADFKQMQSPQIQMRAVSGYDSMPSGENNWASPDPLGILFYLHAQTIEMSPYILWEQPILTDVLQSKYPDIPLGKEGIDSTALRYQSTYETSTPHSESYGDSKDSDRQGSETTFGQGWFDLSLYQHKRVKKDIRLRNGRILRTGTKLGDAFPQGLFLARNGKTILDVRGEDKNRKWTAVPYITRPGTLVGGGTSVALQNQDRKNDLTNLKMESIFQDSFRKEFVDPFYIDPATIPNDPTERAVLTGSVPNGGRIRGTVIDTMEPSQLSPEVFAETDKIESSMQNQLGAFSSGGAGMPDIAPAAKNTATGFLAYRETSVQRFTPMQSVKADALDKEQAYQFLLNDQQYLTPEQWEDAAGDYGKEAIKAFLNCDLKKELIIEVVDDSYMPMSNTQDKANMMGFSQFIAETQIPLNSEQAAYAAERFQIPKEVVNFGAQYDTAQSVINLFKDIAEEIVATHGDIPAFDLRNPIAFQVAQMISQDSGTQVDSQMDDHAAMMDSYKDWWSTDEGRASSNVLKAAIRFRYEEHRKASAQAHAEDQELAMEANKPMMDAQNAQQNGANQDTAAAEQAKIEAENNRTDLDQQNKQTDTEMQLAGHVKDIAENEAKRQHEIKLKEMDNEKAEKAAK